MFTILEDSCMQYISRLCYKSGVFQDISSQDYPTDSGTLLRPPELRFHRLPDYRPLLVRVREQLIKLKTEILKEVVSGKVEVRNTSVSIIEIEDGIGNAV